MTFSRNCQASQQLETKSETTESTGLTASAAVVRMEPKCLPFENVGCATTPQASLTPGALGTLGTCT